MKSKSERSDSIMRLVSHLVIRASLVLSLMMGVHGGSSSRFGLGFVQTLAPDHQRGRKLQSPITSYYEVPRATLNLHINTRSTSPLFSSGGDKDGETDDRNGGSPSSPATDRRKIRSRVKNLARGLVTRPFALASTVPMPRAIAEILKDASLAAVEQVDEVIQRNSLGNKEQALQESTEMMTAIIDDAFAPVEASLAEMEASLALAKVALASAKLQSSQAIEAIQVAAIAQAEGAATAVAQAEKVAEREVIRDIYSSAVDNVDVSKLSFDDVDYQSSEMSPPFLDPDSCLVPGEPVVRVEKAPENSRRIFAGVDILASVDDVWKVLTDYGNLQNVVPNLVVNEVLATYDGEPPETVTYDVNAPEEVQCKQVASKMKGSLLKQVGGAKVAGINFSAKTTLEVREWPQGELASCRKTQVVELPVSLLLVDSLMLSLTLHNFFHSSVPLLTQGMPDFAHFKDDMFEGKSRDTRAKENAKIKLQRYRFPRPFALSSLPTKDISMQSIVDDDGEFRMYQGVWRMQPLPGCSPPGKNAMRLTYAVEISPRAYLPVQLVEGRIVRDLCTNLEAIRDAVTKG